MKKKKFACVSSTKLDFSVGSFGFRLQVEADHHGATKQTQTLTADHTGKKQQHTPLSQPAHSAHTAGSTQTTGAAGDSAHTGGSTQTTGVVANCLHVRVFDRHTQQTTRATTAAHITHTSGTQRSHSGQHTDNGRSGRQ